MTLDEWLKATSTKRAGLTEKQRQELQAERHRVLEKAGTTINSLRVTKCKAAKGKGRLGDDILRRMVEATKGERHRITA